MSTINEKGLFMTKKELEARVEKLESILAIQKLQAKYGYYLQRGSSANWDEMVDLFTDDCKVEIMDSGVHFGKAGVIKLYKEAKTRLHAPGLMGIIMQLQPYIEVYGDTAKGVWQEFGFVAHAQATSDVAGSGEEKAALWHLGRAENEYRKVNGEWKISETHFKLIFLTPYSAENGWVSHPVVSTVTQQFDEMGLPLIEQGVRPSTEYRPYNPQAKTPEEAMPDPILPPPGLKNK